MKNLKRRGFTLIEMLIVVVIIGILAAALIPRLGSAKGKANDSSRATALGQIGNALNMYIMDYGWTAVTVPSAGTASGAFSGILISGGIQTIPADPAKLEYTTNTVGATGSYAIIQVQKSPGQSGFVVIGAVESEGSANWVEQSSASFTGGTVMSSFVLCSKVIAHASNSISDKAACTGPAKDWRKVVVY